MTAKDDRVGNTIYYSYDSLGRVLTKWTENNHGDEEMATYYSYTFTGQPLTEVTYTQNYSLNGARYLEQNGANITYEYDALGRMTAVTTQHFQTEGMSLASPEEYEVSPAAAAYENVQTNVYEYDIGGNRTSLEVYISGDTYQENTYVYDAMGRMTSVTDKDNNTTQYTYNGNGTRSSIIYPNGVVGTYTYNQVNLLEQIAYSGTDSATQPRYTYTYYLDGNVASETKENGESTVYVYDDLGRLTSESLWNGTSLVQRYAYTYDDFGNRTKLTVTGADAYTTTYTYNLANQLTTEAKTQSGSTSTATYTYTRNGTLQKKDTGVAATTVYYYHDVFGRMTQTTVGGTATMYQYLTSGLRFSKSTGGVVTEHFYDGNNVVLDLQGSTVLGEYVYGVNLISRDGSSYYLHNGHGDVTYLTDDEGSITKTYEYDAFGNEEDPVSTDTNPFRYAGEYYDKETGTYYLRARYYDPVIGRFIQEDPHWNQSNMLYGDDPLKLNNYTYAPSLAAIIQSGNLYAYCGNNPIMYVDESGNAFMLATGAIGAVVGGIGGVIHSYSKHGKLCWKNVAIGATIGGLAGLGIGASGSLLAISAMGGTSLTLSTSQTFAGFSALLKGGVATTFWGVSKDGINQGIRHFYDYATRYSDRLAEIAKKLNIDLTIDKVGFERFTNAAMNIVNNYQNIGGLMKESGSKASYYFNGVIVVTYDGKLQSVMIGSLKYFEKMK